MRFIAASAVVSLVLMSLDVGEAAARVLNRQKRTFDLMRVMTDCALGNDTIFPKLPGYACHCRAIAPPESNLVLDDMDKCCQKIHECHRKAFEHKPCSNFTDVGPWAMEFKTEECKDNKQKCCKPGQCGQTKSDLTKCGSRICKCDYKFSQCARKAYLNPDYVNYKGNCIPSCK